MRQERTKELLQRRHARAVFSVKVTGAALLLSSLLLIMMLAFMMRGQLVDKVTVQARMLAANSNAALMFGDKKAGDEILSTLKTIPTIEAAGTFDMMGNVLAQYSQPGVPPIVVPDQEQKRIGYHFTLTTLSVSQPVIGDEQIVGAVSLRYDLMPFYREFLLYAGVVMLVAAGALLIVSFLLSRMRVAVGSMELHLDYLAHTDPITSLMNRHAFNRHIDETLQQAKEMGKEVGLVLLDLDNFKVVNDTMGHQYGDEILRMVSRRLTLAARATDSVYRIGGDEFAVIMVQREERAKMDGIAQRMLQIFSQPFLHQEHEFFLTASVGCSLYPRDAVDGETLIRKADTAMYSAKEDGKNTFAIFQPEMDAQAQRRLLVENQLRKALEKNELSVHYQPLIELKSGRIFSVEALLRFNHPEMGMISPVEFIPVAESSGLIVEVGSWVLHEVSRQMADWRQVGIAPERVAVNLSTRQLKDPALPGKIHAVMHQHGLSPSVLEMEITEGILMENTQSNIVLLESMRQMGINISIDDFGTGYSSLSYLKMFPINQVKIDRAFMRDIPGEGETFITAIIAMAHSLGLSVVAEGVETENQFRFLQEAQCDFVQGFYFARPQPAEQLEALLRASRPFL